MLFELKKLGISPSMVWPFLVERDALACIDLHQIAANGELDQFPDLTKKVVRCPSRCTDSGWDGLKVRFFMPATVRWPCLSAKRSKMPRVTAWLEDLVHLNCTDAK